MKKLFYTLAFVCIFILCGCPLMTKHSMDNGSYKIPSWLGGTWKQVSKSGDTKTSINYIELSKKNIGHLTAHHLDSNGKQEKPAMRCIMSDIDGQPFLSVYEEEADTAKAGWYIFKFKEISTKEFELIPLKAEIMPFDSKPDQIKSFLSANKDKAEIYSATDSERYIKVK